MYEWVKAFHVVSIIAWMAGLLYLPRLFVYHANAATGSELSETFKIMERRLYRAIMTPAMIASWVFGIWMIVLGDLLQSGTFWLYVKLVLVLALSGFHGMCARWVRDFARDQNTKSHVYFRVANELPTVAMLVIVGLVIIQPF